MRGLLNLNSLLIISLLVAGLLFEHQSAVQAYRSYYQYTVEHKEHYYVGYE